MLNHTLVSDIAQGRALSLAAQLPGLLHPRTSCSSCFPWEVMGRKYLRGPGGRSVGWEESRILNFLLYHHETRQLPAEHPWVIYSLSVQITAWEPFMSWRKVTPSKGSILNGPRPAVWNNTRHCKFNHSSHIFLLQGLLHHC